MAAYRPVKIQSVTASQFYYARSDIFEAAGGDDAGRLSVMLSRASFGPYNLPAFLDLMEGMAYDFFPRCAGAASLANRARQPIHAGTSVVDLAC